MVGGQSAGREALGEDFAKILVQAIAAFEVVVDSLKAFPDGVLEACEGERRGAAVRCCRGGRVSDGPWTRQSLVKQSSIQR